MNFKKYYLNGNRFTIYITYRNKKYDIKIESWWNNLMGYLTKLTKGGKHEQMGIRKKNRKDNRQKLR
jgi:hypothetical protein